VSADRANLSDRSKFARMQRFSSLAAHRHFDVLGLEVTRKKRELLGAVKRRCEPELRTVWIILRVKLN
jgi:hypothetical protein